MGEGGKRYMIDTGEFRTPYAHYTIHAHTTGSARATSSPFKNRGVTEETFTRNARLASLTGLPSREISFFILIYFLLVISILVMSEMMND